MSKRRGRPKKAGSRYPSGQLRPVKVGPTAQLIARRIAHLVIAGVDPSKPPPSLKNTGLEESTSQPEFFRLAESWLGVLYAARVINAHEFRAGNKYHYLYKSQFPQAYPGSVLDPSMPTIDGMPYQPFEGGSELEAEVLEITDKVLRGLGRRTYDLVKNVCCYGRFEGFIDATSKRSPEAWKAAAEDRTRFVEGLRALAVAYGYGPESAVAEKIAA